MRRPSSTCTACPSCTADSCVARVKARRNIRSPVRRKLGQPAASSCCFRPASRSRSSRTASSSPARSCPIAWTSSRSGTSAWAMVDWTWRFAAMNGAPRSACCEARAKSTSPFCSERDDERPSMARRVRIRKGQAPGPLTRAAFRERFAASFLDPNFDAERQSIARIAEIAWRNYKAGRKAPLTRKAGAGFADPDYALSVEWSETRARLRAAERAYRDPATRSRVLVIVGSPRNDGTCPGESSKSFRLAVLARRVLERRKIEVDLLDLSLLTSDYGRRIYPCKG